MKKIIIGLLAMVGFSMSVHAVVLQQPIPKDDATTPTTQQLADPYNPQDATYQPDQPADGSIIDSNKGYHDNSGNYHDEPNSENPDSILK